MKKILFVFFIFFSETTIGQLVVKGTIKDSYGNNISQANVFFNKKKQSNTFEEFTIAKNGYFEHILKRKYDSLYITIQTLGYEEEVLLLKKLDVKTINLKFELIERTIFLDEVFITSKKRPFTIKKDTIRYSVKVSRPKIGLQLIIKIYATFLCT
ncbi:MAG: hypothetical protein GKR88_13420 [Flavobacteriaceae bacterium]|nr:MAG: hypothetical protein GKR88_13420 [Flavobacteriaceae bacterium]